MLFWICCTMRLHKQLTIFWRSHVNVAHLVMIKTSRKYQTYATYLVGVLVKFWAYSYAACILYCWIFCWDEDQKTHLLLFFSYVFHNKLHCRLSAKYVTFKLVGYPQCMYVIQNIPYPYLLNLNAYIVILRVKPLLLLSWFRYYCFLMRTMKQDMQSRHSVHINRP